MKTKFLFSILMVTILFASCKKESIELNSENPPIVDKTKAFLKDVRSDDSSDYYISGEFDGYKIYCASTFANTCTVS